MEKIFLQSFPSPTGAVKFVNKMKIHQDEQSLVELGITRCIAHCDNCKNIPAKDLIFVRVL